MKRIVAISIVKKEDEWVDSNQSDGDLSDNGWEDLGVTVLPEGTSVLFQLPSIHSDYLDRIGGSNKEPQGEALDPKKRLASTGTLSDSDLSVSPVKRDATPPEPEVERVESPVKRDAGAPLAPPQPVVPRESTPPIPAALRVESPVKGEPGRPVDLPPPVEPVHRGQRPMRGEEAPVAAREKERRAHPVKVEEFPLILDGLELKAPNQNRMEPFNPVKKPSVVIQVPDSDKQTHAKRAEVLHQCLERLIQEIDAQLRLFYINKKLKKPEGVGLIMQRVGRLKKETHQAFDALSKLKESAPFCAAVRDLEGKAYVKTLSDINTQLKLKLKKVS